ncbi:hypothetical protein HDU83_009627 [Entophlyctis luteolus]|nr:hypothetical protein HDU83_009627 [Entophlyctis luteolus]KAJ3394011.1 hypothetical protein HDU84_000510 [Entophlyctis sp. JEL0112]
MRLKERLGCKSWLIALASLLLLAVLEISISESAAHKPRQPPLRRPDSWGFADPVVLVGDDFVAARNSTSDVVGELPLILASTVASDQSPYAVVVMLGASDWLHGISTAKYVDNSKAMMLKLRRLHPTAKIVFVTPPPVDRALEPYRSALVSLTAEVDGVSVFDTWALFLGPDAVYKDTVKKFFGKGLSFSVLGHETFYRGISVHL